MGYSYKAVQPLLLGIRIRIRSSEPPVRRTPAPRAPTAPAPPWAADTPGGDMEGSRSHKKDHQTWKETFLSPVQEACLLICLY